MSVSVVIPTFRAVDTLERTIVSCLPHVRPRNIIVVLDGPDHELESAAWFARLGVRILTLPRQSGAPVCRNEGLALVETEFVMFLDADDYVEGDLLPAAADALHAARADVALTPFCFETPGGARVCANPRERYGAFDRVSILRKWLTGDYTPPCAVLWRADFVRGIGGWDEALAKNQDGDLMYRALLCDARTTHSDSGLGVYVQGEDPRRITRRNNPRTLTSQLAVLDRIREHAPEQRLDLSDELSLAYYAIARLAYSDGFDKIGQHAEEAARQLGLAGQPGNPAHIVVASLLGLRGKQRFASFVRKSVSAIAS